MLVRGTLDKTILNEDCLYDGNLVKYFQIIFIKAKNLRNPYHNFRHVMHVTWLCYAACTYYSDILSKREMRNLLIAAMFHDFDHRGTSGADILNIILAVQAIRKYVLPEDEAHLDDIVKVIESTEYPYKAATGNLNLCCQIIRDADLSQALCSAWLQQVIFGLSAEWGKTPLDVLRIQTDYHAKLNFYTEWAKEMWPREEIAKKIEEVTSLLQILETDC